MDENLVTQQTLPLEELGAGTQQEKEWEAVIEAVLFTMGNSVELRQLAAAIEQDEKTARAAVLRLKKRYEEEPRGIRIIELEDSFQMCTKAAYYEHLIRVASAPKKQVLTDVVLETLSIIAYKQPVTKMEIEKIRGVKSDHAVNRLVEYNLVYEVGRLDAPGRPALFATTEEFLRRFGIGSAQNLPAINPEQVEEIKSEVEKELNVQEDVPEDGDGRGLDEAAAADMTGALDPRDGFTYETTAIPTDGPEEETTAVPTHKSEEEIIAVPTDRSEEETTAVSAYEPTDNPAEIP